MTSFEEKLASLPKPSVDFPQHRAQLRRALLNSPRSRSTPLFMSFYKLIPATLVLALIFGLSFAFRPQELLPPRASAKELLENVLVKLQSLSPDELDVIAQKIGVSNSDEIMEDLKGAVLAADLAYVDKKELSCEDAEALVDSHDSPPAEMDYIHMGDDQSAACTHAYELFFHGVDGTPRNQLYLTNRPDASDLTDLEYTDAQGRLVVLKLTEDLLPAGIQTFTSGGSTEGTIMVMPVGSELK